MCLAVPMKIKEIRDNNVGVVVSDEATYNVSFISTTESTG